MENINSTTQEKLAEIDALLNEKKPVLEGEPKRPESEAQLQFKGRMKALPAILRGIGAIVLIASATTFLMQQWQGLDHIERYFSFLGFTGVLALAGFFCGLKLREDKGARTLLALSAAIIPVHFCQLGAFLYSCFSMDGNVHGEVPNYLLWVAPDAASAAITVAIGLVVLLPIAFLAFSALCRSEASRLTLAYAVANSMLLFPTRNPDVIGVLVLGLLAGIAMVDANRFKELTSMRTREGAFCRGMLAVPALIMIGRTLQLYPTSELFFSMLCSVGAVVAFAVAPKYCSDKTQAIALQTASVVPAGLAWYLFCLDMFAKFQIVPDFRIPMVVLPFCVILGVMSVYAVGNQSFFRKSAALLAVSGMALQLVVFSGILSSLLIVVASIVTIAYGYVTFEKTALYLGILGFAFGLIYHLRYAAELYTMCPWLSLGVAGLLTVLAGSYIEKNWVKIAEKVAQMNQRMEARKVS